MGPFKSSDTIYMPTVAVKWRPVRAKSIRGQDYDCPLPDALDFVYCGQLLKRIQDMERTNPISFESAIRMVREQTWSHCKEDGHLFASWYVNNFVQWLSDKGFHIELTGSEYELSEIEAAENKLFYSRKLLRDKTRTVQFLRWRTFKHPDRNGYHDNDEQKSG